MEKRKFIPSRVAHPHLSHKARGVCSTVLQRFGTRQCSHLWQRTFRHSQGPWGFERLGQVEQGKYSTIFLCDSCRVYSDFFVGKTWTRRTRTVVYPRLLIGMCVVLWSEINLIELTRWLDKPYRFPAYKRDAVTRFLIYMYHTFLCINHWLTIDNSSVFIAEETQI